MKKIILILLCLVLSANIVLADDVFLSLTKYEENLKNLPTNITVISHEKIESSHAQTLAELLEYESGIIFNSYGPVGAARSVCIRGASSLQTLVLVDGRRVNDAGLGNADFMSVPVSAIEKIEIIRGAGASIYGTSAFGGVINVITKKANEYSPLIDASLSYGSFHTYDNSLTAAYASRKLGGLLSFSHIKSDGYRTNSAFNGSNLFGSFYAKINDYSKLSITGNIYIADFGVPGSTSWATPDNEQKDNNKYAKVDYAVNMSEDFFMNLSAYYSYNTRKYYDATGNAYDWIFSEEKDKYVTETVGVLADFHFKDFLLAGFEWYEDDYRQKESLSGYNLEKSRINSAGYAQLKLSAFDSLTFLPGIRYDSNSQFGDVITPSASAIFNLSQDIKISANAGKVWRAPVFTELYWNQPAYMMYGDPELKPEKGFSGDIGAELSKDKIKLTGNFFYIKSEDLISWNYDPMTYESRVINIDKAEQYGFEFETGYIMNSYITHKLGYTYLNAENVKTGKKLTYKPENTFNYTFILKPVENLSFSGTLFYKDKVFINAANTQELKDIVTLDLGIRYKINENITLWGKALNIGNAKYELSGGYPMPGATGYGGVEIKIY